MKKDIICALIVFIVFSYMVLACQSKPISESTATLNQITSTQISSKTAENATSIATSVLIPPFPYQGTPLSPQLDSVEDEMIDGMNKVKLIIESIEKYYLDNGTYPDNLSILTTNYLTNIPTTITGEQFQYQLSKSNIYTIYFKVQRSSTENREVYCGFIRRLLTWECSGTSH